MAARASKCYANSTHQPVVCIVFHSFLGLAMVAFDVSATSMRRRHLVAGSHALQFPSAVEGNLSIGVAIQPFNQVVSDGVATLRLIGSHQKPFRWLAVRSFVVVLRQRQACYMMASIRERCMDAAEEVSSLIEERLQLLGEKEKAWQLLELRMQDNAKQASDKIKLDVGGKIFATSKTNLLRFEGSYFHAMLASGHWEPDSDGAYFIDRNPEGFDRVLDYLRKGELSFDDLRPNQIQQLRKTLDYLLLSPPIVEPTQWDPQCKGNAITLSGEDLVATNASTGWQAVQSTTPCTRFTVRFVSGRYVMIGFAPRAGFNPNAATHNSSGWYFYTYDGTLFGQSCVSSRAYGSAVAVGSNVTAVLDRLSNIISFEVNGQAFGTAHSNIPAGDLYACVCLYQNNSVALETE